jgi:hypothetical protein
MEQEGALIAEQHKDDGVLATEAEGLHSQGFP